MICPYCNSEASIKDSSLIYGRSYGKVLICHSYPKCDAFVGVHKKDGVTPLGTMANGELREWRKMAHNDYFDPLWKSGKMTRSEAYKFMQTLMELPEEKAHIAMFDIDQCKTLIEKLKQCKN